MASVACGVFLLYAAIWLLLVKLERTPLSPLVVAGVFADVACAGFLILSTDGYLSPFNLWLVFAVVASGYSRFRFLPVLATGLGILAHTAIAQVPQYLPLQTGVFAVRTAYLFGFAYILAFLGSRLAIQSRALELVERAGGRMGESLTLEAIAQVLADSVKELNQLPLVSVAFANGLHYPAESVNPPSTAQRYEFPLECSGGVTGTLSVWCERPPTQDALIVLRVLCSRAAASAIRIILSEGMARSAAREERARLADEIHDSMLQTLAAIDLRAEAARTVLATGGDDSKAMADITTIKEMSQLAADDLRTKIIEFAELQTANQATVEASLRERWPGTIDVDIQPNLSLDESAWQVLMAMVREGTNNALEHGQGSHLKFAVLDRNGQIEAKLSHLGKPLPERIEYGFGLKRLESMAEALNGSMSLSQSEDGYSELKLSFRRTQ